MTTSDNLQSISTCIRALLAKAADAGVTEHEALAFAAKARELMERYQLGLSDLELRIAPEAEEFHLARFVVAPNFAVAVVGQVHGEGLADGGGENGHPSRRDALLSELAEWLYVALVSRPEPVPGMRSALARELAQMRVAALTLAIDALRARTKDKASRPAAGPKELSL